MTTRATARQNEPLDAICWRVLGTTDGGVLEQALMLNRGLAELGVFLPEGTVVILPDIPDNATSIVETVNLWD